MVGGGIMEWIMVFNIINPLASPSAGAPALKYGDVNIVTPSPGDVKGSIKLRCVSLLIH